MVHSVPPSAARLITHPARSESLKGEYMASDGRDIITLVAQRQDCEQFRRKNWVGTFAEYLDLVRERPQVTRTAYQRIYDMILSYGVDVTEASREKHSHYRFFDDPDNE